MEVDGMERTWMFRSKLDGSRRVDCQEAKLLPVRG
jgi:hypothetical protein